MFACQVNKGEGEKCKDDADDDGFSRAALSLGSVAAGSEMAVRARLRKAVWPDVVGGNPAANLI